VCWLLGSVLVRIYYGIICLNREKLNADIGSDGSQVKSAPTVQIQKLFNVIFLLFLIYTCFVIIPTTPMQNSNYLNFRFSKNRRKCEKI